MKFFKRIWCRTYQACFKVAIPLLPYRQPEQLQGISAVVSLLKEREHAKALIVTDKQLSGLKLYQPLTEALKASKIAYKVFDDVNVNPTISNVEDGLAIYKKEGCDCIIAFGGGSPIDCAKTIGLRLAKPKKSVEKMKGISLCVKKLPTFIAVPTTAGTGSETTLASVIIDEQTRHKIVITDFSVIPEFALLDAEFTKGLPPMLTATTGMDALTHAIEAYIGRSTTAQTRTASLDAIKLIFENLEKAYKTPTNAKARQNMLHASYLAGVAFTKSYVGYVHAIAHSLGGQYNTAHGLANAVILPYVLAAYDKSVYKKLSHIAVHCGLASDDDRREIASRAVIDKIIKMRANMGIPNTLEEIKIEDIKMLAARASSEANPLYPVPRLFDASELEGIYRLLVAKGGEADE